MSDVYKYISGDATHARADVCATSANGSVSTEVIIIIIVFRELGCRQNPGNAGPAGPQADHNHACATGRHVSATQAASNA